MWDRADAGEPVARLGVLVRKMLDQRNDERKKALEEGSRPIREATKTWSQNEFFGVYPNGKDLLNGVARFLPSRDVVLSMAEYFEASFVEANDLLSAAGYHDRGAPLDEAIEAAALSLARRMIDYLPLPAFVMNRRWFIPAWNGHLETLFDFANAEGTAIPESDRHILRLIFDERFPFYQRLGGGPGSDNWRIVALQNIYLFRLSNLSGQYEPWYQDLIRRLRQLPDFVRLWDQVTVDKALRRDPRDDAGLPLYRTEVRRADGTTLWVVGLETSIGNWDLPRMTCYVPDDPESQVMFEQIGLPTPGNHWGFLRLGHHGLRTD